MPAFAFHVRGAKKEGCGKLNWNGERKGWVEGAEWLVWARKGVRPSEGGEGGEGGCSDVSG